MKYESIILAAVNAGVWFMVFYTVIMLGKINRTQDEILKKVEVLLLTEPFSAGVPDGK